MGELSEQGKVSEDAEMVPVASLPPSRGTHGNMGPGPVLDGCLPRRGQRNLEGQELERSGNQISGPPESISLGKPPTPVLGMEPRASQMPGKHSTTNLSYIPSLPAPQGRSF
jgi:hypothetical protein